MELWQFVVYGSATFLTGILSGIVGGGGGFIMTPITIFIGLTPAQAVSTGKINGLAISLGALAGMHSEHGKLSWRRIVPVMILALVVGIFVPFVIVGLESQVYRILLGVILLLMIPLIIFKKMGIEPHHPSRLQKAGGGILLAISLFLLGAFSGGLGTLVNVVLMGMLGMTAIEANITKRWSQIILNVTVVIGVLWTGLIVWQLLAVGVPLALIGSYIGGHIGVKKGNRFVINVMVGMMVVAGLWLIFGA